ncbi:hypothetical protein GXP70_25385 [Paenibacillus lycopersici]|uniref:Accessory regulator AgrB n=1 Tax=Paenibacillus lycopersici TaxID=2704462 RepID=A0A6C0G2D0_9BACL|nr:accessory gene regulator B family protein [Paenibacillus lycopersici]QHT62967.1 hypothetical protein GXP70_25385 [Paenibacillus lycopersici]
MGVVLKTAGVIAEWMKKSNDEITSSVERLTALVAIHLNNYGAISTVLLVGAFTGKFIPTCIGLVCFILLRIHTGGFHFKSLDHCFIFSTCLLSFIPHIHLNDETIIVLNIFSAALIYRYSERKIALPVIAVLLNCFVLMPVIALSFLAQSGTLIKRRG